MQFIYATAPVDDKEAIAQDMLDKLQTLPAEWREAFRLSAIKGHIDDMARRLDEIPPEYCDLADSLRLLLARYDLERLTELFETDIQTQHATATVSPIT